MHQIEQVGVPHSEIFPIETIIHPRSSDKHSFRVGKNSCHSNLIPVKIIPSSRIKSNFTMCTLNCQSVKNKSVSLNDFIVSNDYDLVALTETWLGTSYDTKCLNELVPNGYQIKHIPRSSSAIGGGVALLFKSSLKVRHIISDALTYKQFEFISCLMTINEMNLQLSVVYRPPPNAKNGLKVNLFFEEFQTFLENHCCKFSNFLLTGDLNFHLDDPSNYDTKKFNSLCRSLGLCQLIQGATHKKQHTLDVLITRETCFIVKEINISDPALCNDQGYIVGDHFAITSHLHLTKPPVIKKRVTYRRWSKIDKNEFNEHLVAALARIQTSESVEEIASALQKELKNLGNSTNS